MGSRHEAMEAQAPNKAGDAGSRRRTRAVRRGAPGSATQSGRMFSPLQSRIYA